MDRIVIVTDHGDVIADITDKEVKVKRGYVAYVLTKPKERVNNLTVQGNAKDINRLKK